MKLADHLAHESRFRGAEALQRRATFPITICGCGALGSWLLDLLVRQGYHAATIIDRERVDKANYGTQNYGQRDTGRMKASISANNLYMRLGVKVVAVDDEVKPTNVQRLIKGSGLVIDLFDNPESRNLLRDACKTAGIPCLHAGMSGDGFAEVEWNENYTAHPNPPAAGNEPCDYPLAANLVHFTVGLVAEVVNRFVDTGVKQSVHFTLKDMHVHTVWESETASRPKASGSVKVRSNR